MFQDKVHQLHNTLLVLASLTTNGEEMEWKTRRDPLFRSDSHAIVMSPRSLSPSGHISALVTTTVEQGVYAQLV